jgi:hypothetical protein
MSNLAGQNYTAMINDYLAFDVLEEETKKQSWLLDNCTIKKDWYGGDIIVPFKAGKAGTITMGGLPATDSISRSSYVRGKLVDMKEAYGSLIMYEKDLMFNGKINEQNFIKILPDQLDDLKEVFAQSVSIQVLNGGALDTVTGNGTAGGVITVAHPERFTIGMKVSMAGTAETATGFVSAINVNTGALTIVTTPHGVTGCVLNADAGDATQADIDAGDLIYVSGGDAHNFTSMMSMLLPSGIHSGTAALFGHSKVLYPYLQSIYTDGDSTCTSVAGFLAQLFDTQGKFHQRGANPKEWLVSWKNYLGIKKAIELATTSYRILETKDNFKYAGTKTMTIGGVEDDLTLRAIREYPDYLTMAVDIKDLEFHCPPEGFFTALSDPEGKKYYTVRTAGVGAAAGYAYVTDIALRGEFIHTRPWNTGVIYRTDATKTLIAS